MDGGTRDGHLTRVYPTPRPGDILSVFSAGFLEVQAPQGLLSDTLRHPPPDRMWSAGRLLLSE